MEGKLQQDKNHNDYAYLRYHQQIVRNFTTMDCDSQGLLIYHETGTKCRKFRTTIP